MRPIYQPPYYQPRLPIGGGGGVINVPAKPKMFGETGLSEIAKIFVEAKKKRQQDEQIKKLLPMLTAGRGMEESLAATQQDTGPKGIAGVLDVLNPFSPARGTTPLEKLYAQKAIESSLKPTRLRPIKGKKNWLLLDPSTGQITDTGQPAGMSNTEQLITELYGGVNKEPTSAPNIPSLPPPTDASQRVTQYGGPEWLPDFIRDLLKRDTFTEPRKEAQPPIVPSGLESLAKRWLEPETQTLPVTPETPKGKIVPTGKKKTEQKVKMKAPHGRLDSIWVKLPTKQKRAIWDNKDKVKAALDNGYSVEEVLAALGVK